MPAVATNDHVLVEEHDKPSSSRSPERSPSRSPLWPMPVRCWRSYRMRRAKRARGERVHWPQHSLLLPWECCEFLRLDESRSMAAALECLKRLVDKRSVHPIKIGGRRMGLGSVVFVCSLHRFWLHFF